MEFTGTATPLGPRDVAAVAAQLQCEPAAIWAVCDIESAGGGILSDKRPKILFEAHVFGRLTGFGPAPPGAAAPARTAPGQPMRIVGERWEQREFDEFYDVSGMVPGVASRPAPAASAPSAIAVQKPCGATSPT